MPVHQLENWQSSNLRHLFWHLQKNSELLFVLFLCYVPRVYSLVTIPNFFLKMDQTESEAQFGELDYRAVDREWEEFSRLMRRRDRRREQSSFYPCPPPEEDDDVNNLVSSTKVIRKAKFWHKLNDKRILSTWVG